MASPSQAEAAQAATYSKRTAVKAMKKQARMQRKIDEEERRAKPTSAAYTPTVKTKNLRRARSYESEEGSELSSDEEDYVHRGGRGRN